MTLDDIAHPLLLALAVVAAGCAVAHGVVELRGRKVYASLGEVAQTQVSVMLPGVR